MNLRDVMAEDIDDVFFDMDEMAEMHNVNGNQLLCIVDKSENKIRSGQQSEQYDGIFLSLATLYVKKTDLPNRPVYGKVLRLDEEPYLVVSLAEEDGLWVITLGLNAK